MIGERLKHYTIDRRIDEGAFGTVYAATNELIKRKVAIKVLHPHLALDPTAISRFRQEAQSAAALHNPGIVDVLDFIEEGRTFAIVMEFVDGAPLNHYLADHARLTLAEKAEIVAKVADALQVAHGAGIIHRDIKPGNILVDDTGSPHLTDFGLAKLQDDGARKALTATGSVLGTPAYMSPEQCAGKPSSPSSDVYSLGVVLYEVIAGQLPFHAETPPGLLQEHIHSTPQSARLLNPSTPEKLEAIVMQCLEKTESQRPSSAGELAAELRSVEYAAHADGVQEGQTEVMNREDLPPARRFGRVAAVAVTVAAILGVVLALFWFSGFGRPPETQARPTRYVEVEINGQLERARFHNLTEDAESGVVSLEDGQIVLVPVDDLVFVTEDSR